MTHFLLIIMPEEFYGNSMFDSIQYGMIPLFIQNKILKIGLCHPICKILKEIELPEIIFEREKSSYSELFFLFYDFNGQILNIL